MNKNGLKSVASLHLLWNIFKLSNYNFLSLELLHSKSKITQYLLVANGFLKENTREMYMWWTIKAHLSILLRCFTQSTNSIYFTYRILKEWYPLGALIWDHSTLLKFYPLILKNGPNYPVLECFILAKLLPLLIILYYTDSE